jgi:hypothetical protein
MKNPIKISTMSVIQKLLTVLIIFFININHAFADYGNTAISMECDKNKNYFRFEPHIIWNEELDKFLKDFPSEKMKKGNLTTYLMPYFEKSKFKDVRLECELKSGKIVTTISLNPYNHEITIFYKNAEVVKETIGSVWDSYGRKYFIEMKSDDLFTQHCVIEDNGKEDDSCVKKK